jgi:cell division transport system permease protein
LQVFFYTLGQFTKNSVSVLMTFFALGIGFSIPIIMYSVVDGFSNIGNQWQERPQITLYLEKSISDAQIQNIKTTLADDPRLGQTIFISAQDGLEQFSTQHQFDKAIALLDENPLPHVFVVYPQESDDAQNIANLSIEFGKIEHVSSAQYDFEWLQKLSALTTFLKRAVLVLASIISIGILLLIANTIRLEISTRRDEIDIIDQLGGSPAFIARPFLYMGFLEGFFGGLMAIIISAIVLMLLSGPLLRLADLYGFAIHLPLARVDIVLIVLGISSLLGWLSAKFTVQRHMQALAPI